MPKSNGSRTPKHVDYPNAGPLRISVTEIDRDILARRQRIAEAITMIQTIGYMPQAPNDISEIEKQ